MNYYNEFDPKACAWLRALIAAKLIPEGHVDERSIVDVQPDDLLGYDQCHFFAGIAGWPEALRIARVPSTRKLWTASLPCQPFSSAGQQKGVEDERHLWPIFFMLVRECRPDLIFGEQVARAIGFDWLDGISADLEGAGYAVGQAVLGAHSVGSPHKRQRLYWMADCQELRRGEGDAHIGGNCSRDGEEGNSMHVRFANDSIALDLADAGGPGRDTHLRTISEMRGSKQLDGHGDACRDALGVTKCAGSQGHAGHGDLGNEPGRDRTVEAGSVAEAGGPCDVGNATGDDEQRDSLSGVHGEWLEDRGSGDIGSLVVSNSSGWESRRIASPSTGHGSAIKPAGSWSDYDLIWCRDEKFRRIESSTFPLVAGFPKGMVPSGDPSLQEVQATAEARTMRLKGYGNAIVPPLAAEFISAYFDLATTS